jgi:Cu(I)/Ag(I) efflux system membrane fusion protein
MHPWITSDKPGNCTICGMALVPIYEGEAAMESKEGVVSTTVPVRRFELTKSLRFSGILEHDENIHRVIAAFCDGRIDQIYVEHVGKHVEKGQPLAAIYSPELLTSSASSKTRCVEGMLLWPGIRRSVLCSMDLAQSKWRVWVNSLTMSLRSIFLRRSVERL